jgi:hypothetical protein
MENGIFDTSVARRNEMRLPLQKVILPIEEIEKEQSPLIKQSLHK